MSPILTQLNSELAAVVDKVQESLVQLSNGRGSIGAGTIWQADGLIITNAHVLRHSKLKATLPDGQELLTKTLAIDKKRDLAALAIEANGLPTIELGDSRKLRPGQWVLALGHPWGVTGATTAGSVIDVGYPPELSRKMGEFIQVSLNLRPGHSGGPLIDCYGRLVGVNTMITGPQVGLAIPVQVVKIFLKEKLEKQVEYV